MERQHRDLKNSIKSTLMAIRDAHQDRWMAVLPWTLLTRRTAFHSELQASPCEVLYGNNVRVPGDLPAGDIHPDHGPPQLLDRVWENATHALAQTSIRRQPAIYYPPTTLTATDVYLKKKKHGPLKPISDGPFRIIDRLGKSAINIKVGTWSMEESKQKCTTGKTVIPLCCQNPL